MKQIITLLVLVGLAYLGFVQVALFIHRQYKRARTFLREVKQTAAMKTINEGGLFEVRVRPQSTAAPQSQSLAPPTPTVAPTPVLVEVETKPRTETPVPQQEATQQDIPQTEVKTERPPEAPMNEQEYENEFIGLTVEKSNSEYITVNEVGLDEFAVLSSTLSSKAASLNDITKSVRTLIKLRDTPLGDELNRTVGGRIKELMETVSAVGNKIDKGDDFDYSKFITTS